MTFAHHSTHPIFALRFGFRLGCWVLLLKISNLDFFVSWLWLLVNSYFSQLVTNTVGFVLQGWFRPWALLIAFRQFYCTNSTFSGQNHIFLIKYYSSFQNVKENLSQPFRNAWRTPVCLYFAAFALIFVFLFAFWFFSFALQGCKFLKKSILFCILI